MKWHSVANSLATPSKHQSFSNDPTTRRCTELLAGAFRQRNHGSLDKVWTVASWLVFAIDGSKLDVPRTRRNEGRYPRSTCGDPVQ